MRRSAAEHAAGLGDMCWADAGALLACASDSCRVVLFKTSGVRVAAAGAELPGHHDVVSCVAPLAGNVVVSGSWDMTARAFDTRTAQAVAVYDAHCAPITAAATWGASTIATASERDCSVLRWQHGGTDAPVAAPLVTPVEPSALCWRNEHTLLVGLVDGRVLQYDTRSAPTAVETLPARHTRAVRRIVVRGDGLATAGDDCEVQLNGVVVARHADYVRGLALLGADALVSGSWDKTLKEISVAK